MKTVIEMAKKACAPNQTFNSDPEWVERFAALIREDEREKLSSHLMDYNQGFVDGVEEGRAMNKLEQAARQSFETWWEREGQEFLYALNTTTDDDIKLVAEFAWKDAFAASGKPMQGTAPWHHPECEGECIACLIERAVKDAYGTQGLEYMLRHINAAQSSAKEKWPLMGYGNVAVGGGKQPDGTSTLLYMDMGETRGIGADTTDLFAVGSTADPSKLMACIYFKDGAAIQQTIDILHEMQAEIGYASLADQYCWACGAKQAQIDRLMLEYCPDEMTHEQMQEWGNNQRPAEQSEQEPVAFADKYGNVMKAKEKLTSTNVRDNWYDRPLYEKAAFDADLYSVAGKLALELECLLLDTKDLSVVSKWWDSAHDALEQWRTIKYAAPVRTKDLTDDEIDAIPFNVHQTNGDLFFARAVIAKFKEKNK